MNDDREGPLKGKKSEKDARAPSRKQMPLSEVRKNKRARVNDIEGGRGVKIRLSQIGIHPGDIVTVVRHGAMKGPMVIEVHGFQLALGRGVAAQILVEEVDP